ncbi:hypothetical protein NX059_007914 [Plenodomus lindquistii]|nr:hypothetical protein NX059_007914 [Plenodomus lindquistii]
MTGRTLTLGALVALSQAKAIVTNNCPQDVYIWSVPQSGSSNTVGLPVKSGSHFEEAWRYGTSTNPGVAIKVSNSPEGIFKGGDELDFAYSVAGPDKSKVHVDLSAVRGRAFDNKITFSTCHGSFDRAGAAIGACAVTDDIELILCGRAATTPAKTVSSSSVKVHPSTDVIGSSKPVKDLSSTSTTVTSRPVPTTSARITPSSNVTASSKVAASSRATASSQVPVPSKFIVVKPLPTESKSSGSMKSITTTVSPSTLPKVSSFLKTVPGVSTLVSCYTSVVVPSKPVHSSSVSITSPSRSTVPGISTSTSRMTVPGTRTASSLYAPPRPTSEKVVYPAPELSTKYTGPAPSSSMPAYTPLAVTTTSLRYPTTSVSTTKPAYAPPGPATDKVKYPAPEPSTTQPKWTGSIPMDPEYTRPGSSSSSA